MLWVQEGFLQFDMVQVRKVSGCTMGLEMETKQADAKTWYRRAKAVAVPCARRKK